MALQFIIGRRKANIWWKLSKMYRNKLKDIYMKALTFQKYNNVVEAAHWTSIVRKVTGTTVYDVVSLPGNRVQTRFTKLGFVFFIIFNSIFFYCTFKMYYYDQTILRMLYSTKLKRYGDDFERFTSLLYVLFIIARTPLNMGNNSTLLQKIIDIDLVIHKTGDIIDYNKVARRAMTLTLGQCCLYFIRMTCVCLSLTSSIAMPLENMYQAIHSDTLALVTTSLFCYYVAILRERFEWINNTLVEIKQRNSWEYKVFTRGNLPAKMVKVVEFQDRHICEKIKTCARVYSMLFETCENINTLFGFALLLTMLHYFNFLILYLFYFMEATASGLFHDVRRYVDFVVYTFWEIAVAVGIIFMIIGFSESTMTKAKKTCYITHEIINEDLSPDITQEAMNLSIQLLHEKPTFSVCGMFDLSYSYILQGSRSVATYLIILLQFVTENNESIL